MPKVLENYSNDLNEGAPPLQNEIEISLFGPGFGECVVVHLGAGDWLVVDSCWDKNREPVAMSYLDKLGVPPGNVRLVVSTHWHDDHIRGLSRLLERTVNSELAISSAIGQERFLRLVDAMKDNGFVDQTGVDEWIGILKTLTAKKGGGAWRPPMLVAGERLLFKRPAALANGVFACEVWSLSPSDESCFKASEAFSMLFPTVNMRSVSPLAPNHTSVVLWLEIADLRVLLGADLEETGSSNAGWKAIVNSNKRPGGKAHIFKIPHHGSSNGHNDAVWQNMVVREPASILTPFFNGKTVLPTPSDIVRLKGLSGTCHITHPPVLKKPKVAGDIVVNRAVNETVNTSRSISYATSHVRLRKKETGEWSIGLFGSAAPII